jgi:hypothetical protein
VHRGPTRVQMMLVFCLKNAESKSGLLCLQFAPTTKGLTPFVGSLKLSKKMLVWFLEMEL